MYRQESTQCTPRKHWYLCLMFISSLVYSSYAQTQASTSPTAEASTTGEKKFDNKLEESKNLTCNDLIYQNQREMCQNMEAENFLQILKHAEWIAADHCKTTFASEKWNCSEFTMLRPYSITRYVTKEAAFVRALSIATLAHTIAIACGENFTTCYRPATVPPTKDEKGHLTYQGYAENITYGLEIAKEFFETYEQSKSYIGDKGYVILHNYRAGRMVLESNGMQEDERCRCHGVSASCTVKTCKTVAPALDKVTKELKAMYDRSCLIYSNQLHGSRHLYISNCTRTPPQEKELVHFEASVDFCHRHLEKGSNGVIGRVCYNSTTGVDNCQNVCSDCGKTVKVTKITREYDCECKFVWCCSLQCKKCREDITLHTCI